jgi:NAD(P)-dependent dehydrogenase (short-subunit alcohol dehydrogenase family)
MSKSTRPLALVTGGNRGLGFETCRQLAGKGFHVLLASRNEEKGRAAADSIRAVGGEVSFLLLDVTQGESVVRAEARVRKEFGRLDVLINNAGVLLDIQRAGQNWDDSQASALKVPIEVLRQTFETNIFGVYRMCQAFAPLLIETARWPGAACRIVNLSSGMGQLSEMNGGFPAYRISKTGVNAITRIFSDELKEHKILVNSICPGWVKTDMGGPEAELSLEEGVDSIVWAATLPLDGPTGGFFRERKQINW